MPPFICLRSQVKYLAGDCIKPAFRRTISNNNNNNNNNNMTVSEHSKNTRFTSGSEVRQLDICHPRALVNHGNTCYVNSIF